MFINGLFFNFILWRSWLSIKRRISYFCTSTVNIKKKFSFETFLEKWHLIEKVKNHSRVLYRCSHLPVCFSWSCISRSIEIFPLGSIKNVLPVYRRALQVDRYVVLHFAYRNFRYSNKIFSMNKFFSWINILQYRYICNI